MVRRKATRGICTGPNTMSRLITICSGKSGLLRTLANQWSQTALVQANRLPVLEVDEPIEIVRVVAESARKLREEYGDVFILMLATAPHDKDVSEA